MKKFLLLIAVASLSQVALASDDIAARLAKVGEVCLEGEACASATGGGAVAAAASGAANPESTYNTACATCHAAGVAGAPLFGDAAAWGDRIDKGMDTLYTSVINGLGAMPAKGMCFACSDDDLRAVTDYMVDALQ